MSAADRIAHTLEALCSPETAGRGPGTPEGEAARRFVVDAFADLDLRPTGETGWLQAVPRADGANVLGAIPGTGPGWIVLGAHYDHLGQDADGIYWGADDNASGVAVMLEVARILADGDPRGRSVLVSAYDAEEPPFFSGPWMGSQWWVDHPTIPLADVDLMVCLDVVGHRLGPDGVPDEVADTVFCVGAELSPGLDAVLAAVPEVPGIVPRPIADWVLPPLSDHLAFRERWIPHLFFTCARSAHYHTPEDRPEHLDPVKMAALAEHIATVIGLARRAPAGSWRFDPDAVDDDATIDTLLALASGIPGIDLIDQAVALLEGMRRRIHHGRLDDTDRDRIRNLLFAVEAMLA